MKNFLISILILSFVFNVVAQEKEGINVISYKGRMVDEAGKPVSGIFPLTFKLYKSEKKGAPIWSEFQWVAVDRGVYVVRLGEKKALPKQDTSEMFIGVEVKGVGEIARERVSPKAEHIGLGPAKRDQSSVKYADSAGFAVQAEHAKNSDRIQNLTIEDLIRKVLEEIGQGGGLGSKPKVGQPKHYGQRIGGPGGLGEYNEVCPKGQVMVGVRGGAGIYIDSIQIICAPIE